MTTTEAIIIYDKAEAAKSDLRSIAKYLAKATDKVRADYLRRYPKIEQALRSL
jgi:plasmid stabilization system protein ParE